MKKYLNPEMVIERLENEDILTTSFGVNNLSVLDFENNEHFKEQQ